MASKSIYSENSRYLFSDSFWMGDGEIVLPRHLKVYFDSACCEYGDISPREKFLELGWCLWNGLNLYAEIKSFVDDHAHIGGYEDSIINDIVRHIEELRSGDTSQHKLTQILMARRMVDGKLVRKLTLKKAVRLFSDELLLRYRPHYLVESYWDYDKIMADCKDKSGKELVERIYSPTPATEIPISEEEIKNINPWKSKQDNYAGNNDIGLEIDKFDSQAKFLLKCDACFINEFNEKHKGTDYEFILNIRPYAINGNPLKAKVVALSLNPGYDYEADYLVAEKLHSTNLEDFNCHRIAELDLKAESFMCDGDTKVKNRDFWKNEKFVDMQSPRDIQNMLGDWYWYDILESFRKEAGLPEERSSSDIIYDNFAVLQYIGYSSKSYKELPASVTLPSQRFTKLLVYYLAMNKKDVMFVVSRSEKLWRKLIGEDVWNMLEDENRLVHRRRFKNKDGVWQTIRTQGFGRSSFEGDGFERIANAFKKCM